jgi:hypothetical protein
MTVPAQIARELASRFLAGAWTKERLVEEGAGVLGKRARKTARLLAGHLVASVTTPYPPPQRALTRMILDSGLFDAEAVARFRLNPARPLVFPPAIFAPAEAMAGLSVPKLETQGDVADWLYLPPEQLEWLADLRDGHQRAAASALRHYTYTFVPKASGPPRLIEAPKPRLKAIQRRILHEILDRVTPHPDAHGFVRGRSCLSGAQRHAGETVVVRLDLRRFFPGIRAARVHGIFRTLGYPPIAARLLTRLCTTRTPAGILETLPDWQVRKEYETPHLPQGAPTSPALANLCAWRLDQRAGGLARRASANYSRYADDLCFSGDAAFARTVPAFLTAVRTIVEEEGFFLNPNKTKVASAATAQRVTGIIVNQHLNLQRRDFDVLKATLHNCVVGGGPELQNRAGHPDLKAHLDGRIGWVEQLNPRRGQKLRRIFERIDWERRVAEG